MTTITCPHGHGEPDFSACCEGFRQGRAGCATCPGPIYLAASGRSDSFNAALADRLEPLLQGTPPAQLEETPPEKPKATPRPKAKATQPPIAKKRRGHISRFKALALAISQAIGKRPGLERIGLITLLRHYETIPCALPIKDESHMRSIIRMAGLPRMILPNSSRALPVNDHVLAFVRSYMPKKVAA